MFYLENYCLITPGYWVGKYKFPKIQWQSKPAMDTEISEIWDYILKKNSGLVEDNWSQ